MRHPSRLVDLPAVSPRTPRSYLALLMIAGLGLFSTSSGAAANRINTGGESGAYHRDLCPPLAQYLANNGQSYTCTPSSGTQENIQRVIAEPRQFGFGQLDVLTLETAQPNVARAIEIVRQDDARECLFAVTRNRDVTSYGELAAFAPNLRFSLPPRTSGSAGTFQFLRYADANGLGRARQVTHADSVDEAIRAALSRDDGVALFVQLPDPDNERFRLVRELGGHFVPVIDRSLISQQIGGRDVYIPQETRIANPRGIENLSGRVTTLCTPLVLFAGATDRIKNEQERASHTDVVTMLRRLPVDVLIPAQSPWRLIAQRTRDLTVEGRSRFLAYSQQARDRALPFIERMIERAAPRY